MKGKGQVRFLESTKRSVRARRVACDEADIPTRSRPLYGHTYSKSMDQPGEVATGKPYDREMSHVSADWCKHKALSDNIK